ncbi:MAG: helix-turn-helix transcriptional regulator [Ignavibacteria bacterium]|nr:helix-turn-helix transcriptional regulator [Ignavibacteria bacterium]
MASRYKTKENLQSDILSAICHPNRIKILKALSRQTLCNCEIMPMIGLEQSNLSRHLKIMEKSGVLVSWKEGLRVNYRIADERIMDILKLAEEISNSNIEKINKFITN